MAPKTDNDVFLSSCFRNLKEKPQVDFGAVATETGMSLGGAKNKFREIMKKMTEEKSGGKEGDDATDDKADSKSDPKPKSEAKTKEPKPGAAKSSTKRKASAVQEETADDSNPEDDGHKTTTDASDVNDQTKSTEESPAKKRKTLAKPNAKAIAPKTQDSTENSEEASGGEKTETEEPTAKVKKAPAKKAARKPTVTKSKADDTEIDADDKKVKPAANRGKGHGKAIKKSVEHEDTIEVATTGEDDETDPVGEIESENATAKPKDKPTAAMKRGTAKATTAKGGKTPAAGTKVEVIVPIVPGTRASSKTKDDKKSDDAPEVEESDNDTKNVVGDSLAGVNGEDEI